MVSRSAWVLRITYSKYSSSETTSQKFQCVPLLAYKTANYPPLPLSAALSNRDFAIKIEIRRLRYKPL